MQCSQANEPFHTLEARMKLRTSVLTLGMLFVGLTMCFAGSPSIGTWKLNEAKSKMTAGAPKNMTVTYVAVGDDIKATIDGVDVQGKPTHNEWTSKFDGKDYPVTGDAMSDMRSYQTVDANTLDVTVKKGGKTIMSGKIVTSADGKTRTVTVSGMMDGKNVTSTAVYDKQ
jgi:hypothetical protein